MTGSWSEIGYIYIPRRKLAQKSAFHLKVSDSDRGCLCVALSVIVGWDDVSAVKHALQVFLLRIILGAPDELVIEAAIEPRSFVYQIVRRFLFLCRVPSFKRLMLLAA